MAGYNDLFGNPRWMDLNRHDFGGGTYGNANAARDALRRGQGNELLGRGGTTGAAGFQGTHYLYDSQGRYQGPGGGPALTSGWGNGYSLPGYRLGDVDIMDQEQRPENPGPRNFATSTYGITIPLSIGKRRVAGNIIEATTITPKIVGEYDYYIEYKVPIYEFGPS